MFLRLTIFLIIIMVSHIHALTVHPLLNDINTSFNKTAFSELKEFNKINTIKVSNFDNNSTLEQALRSYKILLPDYLNESTLFNKESFEGIGDKYYEISSRYHYIEFFNTSILHLKILSKDNNYILIKKIVSTHINNLNALMINSVTMLDYIIALSLYKKLYTAISENRRDSDIYNVLKQNPPPSSDIYYQKIEFEKNSTYKMSEKSLLNQDDFKELGDGYKQLMTTVLKRFKFYYDSYMKKYIISVKSESQKEIDIFKQFMEKEEKDHISFFSRMFFVYEGIKVKLLNRYGYEVDYSGMADFMGKTLALVAYPKFGSTLKDHKHLIKQYEKCLSNCVNKK